MTPPDKSTSHPVSGNSRSYRDARREKEAAIEAQEFQTACDLRAEERALAAAQGHMCDDCSGVIDNPARDIAGRVFCAACAPAHGMFPEETP
jgi:hypothetical protein